MPGTAHVPDPVHVEPTHVPNNIRISMTSYPGCKVTPVTHPVIDTPIEVSDQLNKPGVEAIGNIPGGTW